MQQKDNSAGVHVLLYPIDSEAFKERIHIATNKIKKAIYSSLSLSFR